MRRVMETEVIDKLYLEISRVTKARNERELRAISLIRGAKNLLSSECTQKDHAQIWRNLTIAIDLLR
jgi:hypothetical protein